MADTDELQDIYAHMRTLDLLRSRHPRDSRNWRFYSLQLDKLMDRAIEIKRARTTAQDEQGGGDVLSASDA